MKIKHKPQQNINKMKPSHVGGFILVGMFCLQGCCFFKPSSCSGTATVSCGNVGTYKGDIGTLNTPQFELGQVLYLNTKNHTIFKLRRVAPAPAETSSTAVFPSYEEGYKAALTVSFSGNVPQTVQVDATAKLTTQTLLVVSNYHRVNLDNFVKFANAQGLAEDMKKIQGNDIRFIIVDALVPADYVALEATSTSTNSAHVNVVKFGDFSLSVSYECNGYFHQVASQGPVFFKWDPITVQNDQVLPDTSFKEDLKDYPLIPTIQ